MATTRPQEEQSDSGKQVENSLRTDGEKGAYKLAQTLSQGTTVQQGKYHSWCRHSSGKSVLHHASDLAQSIQAAEGWRSADVLGAVRRNVICRPREKASRSKCATGAFPTSLGKVLTSIQQGEIGPVSAERRRACQSPTSLCLPSISSSQYKAPCTLYELAN